MDPEIHQNCQFSQIMKFILYIVLSSSVGIVTMSLTKGEAEARLWNVWHWVLTVMIHYTGNDFASSGNADAVGEDHWGEIIYLKAFLRTWAYMIITHLMNKVFSNTSLESLSFSTWMDSKLLYSDPWVSRLFLKGPDTKCSLWVIVFAKYSAMMLSTKTGTDDIEWMGTSVFWQNLFTKTGGQLMGAWGIWSQPIYFIHNIARELKWLNQGDTAS